MLTNIENYSWIIILPVFGLLFTAIWNALNRRSCFSDVASFVIALCVSMLCVISIIGFFPQEHENAQEIAVVRQANVSSQEPQQHTFHFILLPYMALMMSFLLLLMIVKIGLLADGVVNGFFRPSYRDKDKLTTTDRQKEKNQITKRSRHLSNNNLEK